SCQSRRDLLAVLFNFSKNSTGNIESSGRLLTCNLRLFTGLDAVKEILQFQPEGLVLCNRERCKAELHRRSDLESNRILTRIIQRNVLVRLKKPQFAYPFGGNTARREIRDAATGKLQSHIGDVDLRRKNADPGRPNLIRHLPYKRENDIDIVDH